MIQLVCRFTGVGPEFLDRAGPAVQLLAAQPTCERLALARSTDHRGDWVLTAEFPDFPGYRRALSPFDVRTTVIPFLSEADQDTSAVYEVAISAAGGPPTAHELLVDL